MMTPAHCGGSYELQGNNKEKNFPITFTSEGTTVCILGLPDPQAPVKCEEAARPHPLREGQENHSGALACVAQWWEPPTIGTR